MKVVTERLKFADLFPEQAGKLAQKLHIKKDEIPFIRKFYTSEKAEVDKKERSVISYISTAAKDRDNEKLLPEGVMLENYRKNPVVLYAHDYYSLPVGKNIWIKQDDKGLIAKTVFAKSEFADHIYKAYTDDIEGTGPLLKAWSVGFIPTKWEEPSEKDGEDAPRRIYTEWELLEYSAVPVPSCPEALTLAYQKGLIPNALKADLQDDVDDLDITIDDDLDITIDPDVMPTTAPTIDDVIEETLDTTLELDPEEKRVEEAIEEAKEEDGVVVEIDELMQEIKVEEKAEEYECECIECGHTLTSEEHCKDIECPECGGEMRRAERPGPGRDLDEFEAKHEPDDKADYVEFNVIMREIREEIAILKEGRVLSTKNRTLVKEVMDILSDLKVKLEELYNATEPTSREEERSVEAEEQDVPIEAEKEVDLGDIDGKIDNAIAKALSADKLKKAITEGVDIAIKKAKGKVE